MGCLHRLALSGNGIFDNQVRHFLLGDDIYRAGPIKDFRVMAQQQLQERVLTEERVRNQVELRSGGNGAAEAHGSDYGAEGPAIAETDNRQDMTRWGQRHLVHGSVALGAAQAERTDTRRQVLDSVRVYPYGGHTTLHHRVSDVL